MARLLTEKDFYTLALDGDTGDISSCTDTRICWWIPCEQGELDLPFPDTEDIVPFMISKCFLNGLVFV